MENQYCFKVYYDKVLVWLVFAHTKWEAVDRAYYKFTVDRPNLERSKFKAKKGY
jgi:hypothetical protein